ncbi:MAG TPA: pyridoxal phosphate-dependent aminotransferase [Nitrospinota bacterium]|jgi:aspartate/methionine/tyrosine aminotransferase|nr:pyridoxal phosphate-dependent aminotransferase [Nitrospinota bacterium]MDP7372091.1 pyridoxal phosphate-dependent aminotransferase [Nitrospinota bacterium]MDP7662664.1 pyridoxal phosphate-dependent aminotransferase [Nitrospinota bacterium]HJP13298.1 pyridoxal phosphate-dependent aminotransferase [Nitrospinota bacterium]
MASFDTDAVAASRIFEVPFSGIRKVFDKVNALVSEGRDVIHWQIGRSDFDTPANIKAAASASLDRGDVHYAPSMGVPSLRKAIAARTEVDTGVEVAWDTQTIVMAGANEGILCAILAFVNPGDEVIIPDPNWHHYKSIVSLAGGVAVEVPTKEASDFALLAEDVEKAITPRTKIICVTSPSNPTGTTVPEAELAKLATLAKKHNLLVLSDEIYSRIYHEGDCAPSIYSQPDMAERTIVINGFSKVFSMDGWRLGWTVASPELTRHMLRVRQYTTVCVNTFIQHGAAAGLADGQGPVEEMLNAFTERSKVIYEGLRSIEGMTVAKPTGAFYAFPNVKNFGESSEEVAAYLLEEHAIATIAGSVFGPAGEGYVRIAYSCSKEDCERGVERLASALDARMKAGA